MGLAGARSATETLRRSSTTDMVGFAEQGKLSIVTGGTGPRKSTPELTDWQPKRDFNPKNRTVRCRFKCGAYTEVLLARKFG